MEHPKMEYGDVIQYYEVVVYEDGERWKHSGGPLGPCLDAVPGLEKVLALQDRKVIVTVEPMVVDGVPWVGDFPENRVREALPDEAAALLQSRQEP